MDEKELFLQKFEEKLKNQLDEKTYDKLTNGNFFEQRFESADYNQFRIETLPKSLGLYEKVCNFCEKILPMKPDKKSTEEINKYLFEAHINCSPTGVQSTSIFFTLIVLIIGLSLFLISSTIGLGLILIAMGMYFALQKIPMLLAKRLKAKANDEVIIAIFYIVAFMRFNSNFELAINFAANYLNPPLSLDFKRVLWQLENSEYPTLKAAMDNYLEKWRDENLEFLESIYLIESSLYESDSLRRISLLDKSLDIILQGNYEKMLHFAQELRNKVTTFNMLGVVLPILGLIILPLAASFGDPKSVWQIVILLYDIVIPLLVGYFGFILTFNRPSTVNSIRAPKGLKKYLMMQKWELKLSKEKSIYLSPKIPAITIFIFLFLISLTPLIFHMTGTDLILNERLDLIFGPTSPFGYFQEFKTLSVEGGDDYKFGPYGSFPGIISLFFPLSFAFGIGYYLRYKYKNLIHMRDKTKKLELQFPSATFQLGNRINEGIAAELAFGAVAETMKGTEAGVFFSKIDASVKFDGMSIEKAIFDEEKGAINDYPSDLIVSSMKILVNAIEKGPEVTAKTLIDLSRYLNEIHMGSERMKDLLAESLGSMKGQAAFLAPVISGVVIAIVSLVTMIMGYLSKATKQFESGDAAGAGMTNLLGESIPTYLFQSTVGIYIVMLISILMYVVVSLENGDDPILTKYEIGEKLIGGLMKYSIVVGLGIVLFSFVGSKVLSGL